MGSGLTTPRDRPYCVGTDTPNVNGDIQALAQSVAPTPNATSGLYSAIPTSGMAVGDFYYATDIKVLWWYNGSTWAFFKGPGPSMIYLPEQVATSSFSYNEVLCLTTFADPGGYIASGAFQCPVAGLYKAIVQSTFVNSPNDPLAASFVYKNHTLQTSEGAGVTQWGGPLNCSYIGYSYSSTATQCITVVPCSAGDLLTAGCFCSTSSGTQQAFFNISLIVEQVG